jgi:hypothetical protein
MLAVGMPSCKAGVRDAGKCKNRVGHACSLQYEIFKTSRAG